jgi:hypothetical protein
MQKRGVARADQAVVAVSMLYINVRVVWLTNSNNVAEQTKRTQVELAFGDFFTAIKHGAQDGCCVAEGQADDTNTGEGVESSGGTEVDETKYKLNSHAKHHGVDGYIVLGVDNPPHLVSGNTTIASESIDGARGGSCASNTAEQGENHEGEEETNGTTGGANSVRDDDRSGLTGQESSKHSLIRQDEDEGNEEDKTSDGVEDNGADHGLGNLGSGVANFFAHTIL